MHIMLNCLITETYSDILFRGERGGGRNELKRSEIYALFSIKSSKFCDFIFLRSGVL